MRVRTLFTVITVILCLSVTPLLAYANVGSPTPSGNINASMFPAGTQVTVDYCYFLNVRRGAGNNYAAITHVSRGSVFTVLEYSQKWVKVDTVKGEGWIYAGYLNRGNSAITPTTNGGTTRLGSPTPSNMINADLFPVGSQATVDFCYFLNVRKGTSVNHATFTHLKRGDTVTILEYSQKWVKVNTVNGDGWIYAGYLSNNAIQNASDSVVYSSGGDTARLGSQTSVNSIMADMFPVGSSQVVDYCYFLNVRRGNGAEYAAFTYLTRGNIITVLEYRNKWVKVDTDKGQGWIYAGYLRRDGEAVAVQPTMKSTSTPTQTPISTSTPQPINTPTPTEQPLPLPPADTTSTQSDDEVPELPIPPLP